MKQSNEACTAMQQHGCQGRLPSVKSFGSMEMTDIARCRKQRTAVKINLTGCDPLKLLCDFFGCDIHSQTVRHFDLQIPVSKCTGRDDKRRATAYQHGFISARCRWACESRATCLQLATDIVRHNSEDDGKEEGAQQKNGIHQNERRSIILSKDVHTCKTSVPHLPQLAQ